MFADYMYVLYYAVVVVPVVVYYDCYCRLRLAMAEDGSYLTHSSICWIETSVNSYNMFI